MPKYSVTVHIELRNGATAESAEIDDMEPRTYLIQADSLADAERHALEWFSYEVAIGVLDNVFVDAEAKEVK